MIFVSAKYVQKKILFGQLSTQFIKDMLIKTFTKGQSGNKFATLVLTKFQSVKAERLCLLFG